jgi:SAM-dependent methyltransferase
MTKANRSALRGEPGYTWRSGQERRLDKIQQWVDLSGRILDNGCGLGTYLEALGPFSKARFGLEVEFDRAVVSRPRAEGIVQGVCEHLPYAGATFDIVLSNEVIEHVADDALACSEMVRVLKPGGRILVFCPNRWYPVEQHGVYWRGEYRFGNIPLVNYLPDALRNRLAPHVRTYSKGALLRLFAGLPVSIIHYSRIFGGYDNIEARWSRAGKVIKDTLYAAENTPLSVLGLSHLLVVEKRQESTDI